MQNLLAKKQISVNQERIAKLITSVKAIYTDVDGTLVGPRGCFFLDASCNYTLKPAEMLVSAHKKDVDIMMVSGRNRLQMRDDARLLGTQNYIAELGCQIIYGLGRETITMDGGLQETNPDQSIYDIIARSGAVELLFDSYPNRLEYHAPWSKQRECTHLFRGFIDADLADRILEEKGYPYLKVVDNGAIRRQGAVEALSEVHAYHLLPRTCGKAEAVKKDREIRDIARESAVGIGDAASDLVLASQVGAFFLVKNALLRDSGIAKKIEQLDNVFVAEQEMGLGFAEVVEFVLNAS